MEEMNDLFYREPYTKEFDSVVLTCEESKNGYLVTLEDTAFYPEGGGQPCDYGTLNGIAVKDVKKKNNVITHLLEKPIEVNTNVHGVVDWERRFDHMQNHTGEHIVSGLIHKHFGYENVGFHMGNVIQIDISGPLDWKQLMMIETEANQIIWKNEKVGITFPSEEELKTLPYRSKKELTGRVRIVTIKDADICACCGTHVANTGEIGLIKILTYAKHGDGVRVEMLSGMRAFAYVQKEHEENKQISVMLSSRMLETGSAVEKLLDTNNKLLNIQKELSEKLLAVKMDMIQDGQPFVLDFEVGSDRNGMIHFANELIEKKNIGVACICNQEASCYSYVILSHSVDLKEHVKTINEKLNGRGGGRSEVLQGSFQSDEETIKKVLHEEFGA